MNDDQTWLKPGVGFASSPAIGHIDDIDTVASLGTPSRRGDARAFARGEGVFVRGWIADPDRHTQPDAVGLVIDNEYETSALGAIPRTDVAFAFRNERYGASGFLALVATDALDVGWHRVRVYAFNNDSKTRVDLEAEESFEICEPRNLFSDIPLEVNSRMRGNVDEIRFNILRGSVGVPDAASVYVRGWACDVARGEPSAEVFGSLGGSTARAVIGFARPDVALALGDSNFECCGFRMRIFTRSLSLTAKDLSVTALSANRARRTRFWDGRVG